MWIYRYFQKQSNSLVQIVQGSFNLDPYNESYVFIFCNHKRDGIKVLRYDRNGFILAYKKLLNKMKFQWPRDSKEISDLSLEKKLQNRQEKRKQLLDAFWSWIEKTKELYTTNDDLIKALNYATNHKVNLMRFLEDPKIPVSNNRVNQLFAHLPHIEGRGCSLIVLKVQLRMQFYTTWLKVHD